MSNKKQQQEPDELQNVEQALSKTEQFIENNRKQLLIGLGVVLVVAIAIVWFFNGYVGPKNVEAGDKMAAAVRYFERDSFALALNGDGMNEGFIEIMDNYGVTESSTLAAFYAGVCEYKLGNYDEAIKYLNKFDAASVNMEPAAITMIGDCYVAKGDAKSAVKYFEKAGAIEKMVDKISEFFSPKVAKEAKNIQKTIDFAFEEAAKNVKPNRTSKSAQQALLSVLA